MAITTSIAKPIKWFFNKLLNKLPFIHLPSPKSYTSSTPRLFSPDHKPRLITPKHDKFLEVFRFFDGDNDGKISTQDLWAYFMSIDERMSPDEVQRVVKEFDLSGDNLLEYKEFVKLMESDHDNDHKGEGAEDVDLRNAFEMFEAEKGCGCITPKGLRGVLERLRGDEKTDQECEEMIRVFDLDGNGVLDFNEFRKMMN